MNRAIRDMFDTLPGVYEFINRVITLGLDTGWRKETAQFASEVVAAPTGGSARGSKRVLPPSGRNLARGEPSTLPPPGHSSARDAPAIPLPPKRKSVWVDVSTGTGELAAFVRGLGGHETTVIATDFSLAMLRRATGKNTATQGRRRPTEKEPESQTVSGSQMADLVGMDPSPGHGILFACADNQALPFRSGSLDLVTISLGTRNLNTSRDALVSYFREFHRVLRPGGWFVNLETSQPDSGMIRVLFHWYVRGFLRPVAAAISRNRSAYSYLASSVCGFYGAEELSEIILEAGFEHVVVQRLFLGVAAIHGAEKGEASMQVKAASES